MTSQIENKKTLHIIDSIRPGGAERVLVNLANLQREYGLHVDIACILMTGELLHVLDRDIQVFNLNRGWKYNPVVLYKLNRIIRQYDIIHVHMFHVFKYVYLCKWIFRIKKKIVFHSHSNELKNDFSLNKIYKSAIRNSIYIGVSQKITDYAVKQFHVKDAYVLPNIVIVQKLSGTHEVARKKQIKLLLVSHFRKQKNIEFAIELLTFLNKSVPDKYSLDIIGKIVDEKYYDEVMRLVKKNSEQDNVRVISDCSDIQQILKNYQLAIHPSKLETGPLVLMEYMAQGLPFLTYANKGEVVSQIKDDLPEFVLYSFKTEDWRVSIEEILKNIQRYNQKLKSLFNKHYSAKNYLDKCLKIYQKVVKN